MVIGVMDDELQKLESELKPTLDRYLSPSPSAQDTHNLIVRLQAEFDEMASMKRNPSILKQFFNQWRTYPLVFWVISLFAFVLLSFIASNRVLDFNSFSLLLPIFLLCSILYSYKTWNKEMRMVEMVAPFPPALLLYLRMLIVLLMVVLYGIIATAFLSTDILHGAFLPFVLTWLAPTLFLGGLLAYVSFLKGVKTGFVIAAAGWLIMNIISSQLEVIDIHLFLFDMPILVFGVLMLFLAYKKSLHAANY
ncbi:hypothetical protein [Pueribacillus theae]|nr:hypothetical protein [Pueribacillus theae]